MIFILGGNGFVGSAFVRHCRRHGLDHAVISRDNYRDFIGRRCDVLINANGNSRKLLAGGEPLQDFDASVRSVRASLADIPSERYLFLSSCDVYPDCSSPETTTEDTVPDVARQSPYGFHKYLAEQCVRHQARHWLIARLGGLLGPGLKKNPIFDILSGGPLWLDPASELQYLSTDAAAAIVFDLLGRGLDREVLNLCGQGLVRLSVVMELAGRRVEARPGSPCVRYDVAVAKLARLVLLPATREAVAAFVKDHLPTRGREQTELPNDDHLADALAR
jgi:nucleoside-diphosphate-sugar epimerase